MRALMILIVCLSYAHVAAHTGSDSGNLILFPQERVQRQAFTNERRGQITKPAFIWNLIERLKDTDPDNVALALLDLKKLLELASLDEEPLDANSFVLDILSSANERQIKFENFKMHLQDAAVGELLMDLARQTARHGLAQEEIIDLLTLMDLPDLKFANFIGDHLIKRYKDMLIYNLSVKVKTELAALIEHAEFRDEIVREHRDYLRTSVHMRDSDLAIAKPLRRLHDVYFEEIKKLPITLDDYEKLTNLVLAFRQAADHAFPNVLRAYLTILAMPTEPNLSIALQQTQLKMTVVQAIKKVPATLENLGIVIESRKSIWVTLENSQSEIVSGMLARNPQNIPYVIFRLVNSNTTLAMRAVLLDALDRLHAIDPKSDRLVREIRPIFTCNSTSKTEIAIFAPHLFAALVGQPSEEGRRRSQLTKRTEFKMVIGPPPHSLESYAAAIELLRSARSFRIANAKLQSFALEILTSSGPNKLKAAHRVAVDHATEYLHWSSGPLPLKPEIVERLLDGEQPNTRSRIRVSASYAVNSIVQRHLFARINHPDHARDVAYILERAPITDRDLQADIRKWISQNLLLRRHFVDFAANLVNGKFPNNVQVQANTCVVRLSASQTQEHR